MATDNRGVKTARDNAPDDYTYRALKRASKEMDDEMGLQCEFLITTLGELGLRAGELSHMTGDWIDLRGGRIKIPSHCPCSCGYCRKQAEQQIDRGYRDQPINELMDERWHPKTSASARTVPYNFSEEIVDLYDRFFHQYEDGWPRSRAAVNRRVTRIAEAAELDPYSVYPHALRAHAAIRFAKLGMRAHQLKKLMGWSKIESATDYIAMAAGDVEAELHRIHNQNPY